MLKYIKVVIISSVFVSCNSRNNQDLKAECLSNEVVENTNTGRSIARLKKIFMFKEKYKNGPSFPSYVGRLKIEIGGHSRSVSYDKSKDVLNPGLVEFLGIYDKEIIRPLKTLVKKFNDNEIETETGFKIIDKTKFEEQYKELIKLEIKFNELVNNSFCQEVKPYKFAHED